MTDYITNLRKTIMKQSNTMDEIKNQKKVIENNVNNFDKVINQENDLLKHLLCLKLKGIILKRKK